MAPAPKSGKQIPVSALVIAVVVAAFLIGGLTYLNRPAAPVADQGGATAEAKAYLPNLELGDVKIQASENFMKQQVVEVVGKISNHGARKLGTVEVYCLFTGVNGREIYRERVPITRNLAPQETREFRLPFDSVPDSWNEAMPRLAIAKISFAS